jgi:hypothetical protein
VRPSATWCGFGAASVPIVCQMSWPEAAQLWLPVVGDNWICR